VTTVLAVDLPLVTAGFLEKITGLARDKGVTAVPVRNGFYEPFAAAWHRSAVPDLQFALTEGRSLQRLCADLQADGRLLGLSLKPDEAGQLANLNTPADVIRVQ
jgi:molybdopterin-guanine dinucleotide biosynthesis protein A